MTLKRAGFDLLTLGGTFINPAAGGAFMTTLNGKYELARSTTFDAVFTSPMPLQEVPYPHAAVDGAVIVPSRICSRGVWDSHQLR
jgi:hypothetical protein